jgi:uncharacterized membrane protein
LPIGGSIYIIYILFELLDGLLKPPVNAFLNIKVPGIGVLTALLLIFFVGLIARNYIGNKLLGWAERLIIRIPVLKPIYFSIKQIVDTIYSKKNDTFKKVVLVEYPRKGIYTIGFITSKAPNKINSLVQEECVSVFIPTTPNPTSGMFIIVPEKDIKYLSIEVEEAIKLIVSGGLVIPDEKTNEGGSVHEKS